MNAINIINENYIFRVGACLELPSATRVPAFCEVKEIRDDGSIIVEVETVYYGVVFQIKLARMVFRGRWRYEYLD
jgi:hypothetical protein